EDAGGDDDTAQTQVRDGSRGGDAIFVCANVGLGPDGARMAVKVIGHGGTRVGVVDGGGGSAQQVQIPGGGIDEPAGLGVGDVASYGAAGAIALPDRRIGEVVANIGAGGVEAILDGPVWKCPIEQHRIVVDLHGSGVVERYAHIAWPGAIDEV